MVIKRISIFLSLVIFSFANIFATQADTVRVYDIEAPPTVNAQMDEAFWASVDWQSIDFYWIDWNQPLEDSDFQGAYKVVWSSAENLLYFYVEVSDDVFVDGWEENGGDYFAYDIIELFLDPDASGGLHVFDGTGDFGAQWGTNAENAFSYHVNIDLPEDGQEYETHAVVNDIAGTDWGDRYNPDFAHHFPEIAFRELDGKYVWEFSLKIYGDDYDFDNPEASRITLEAGRIMGFTMAYCDNDSQEENPKTRDNFIGSVWVSEEQYNDSWMNADVYGTLKLESAVTSVEDAPAVPTALELYDNYPNPFNPSTTIEYSIPSELNQSFVRLTIFNQLGEVVEELVAGVQGAGHHKVDFSPGNAASGVYFYSLAISNKVITKKLMLLR